MIVAFASSMRVLVIEDNEGLRDYLRVALESQEYEVLTARDGQEALGYLNGHRVDAVLTDIFMPEMDGIETIATLRKQFPGVRIIAMSGRPRVGMRMRRRRRAAAGVAPPTAGRARFPRTASSKPRCARPGGRARWRAGSRAGRSA